MHNKYPGNIQDNDSFITFSQINNIIFLKSLGWDQSEEMKLKLVLVGPAKISYNNSNLTSLFCSVLPIMIMMTRF
jgi:hypothetical protein